MRNVVLVRQSSLLPRVLNYNSEYAYRLHANIMLAMSISTDSLEICLYTKDSWDVSLNPVYVLL